MSSSSSRPLYPTFFFPLPPQDKEEEEGSTGNLINGLRLRLRRRPSGLSSLATLFSSITFSAQRFDRLATIDIKSKCDTDCFARNQAALASAFDHLLMHQGKMAGICTLGGSAVQTLTAADGQRSLDVPSLLASVCPLVCSGTSPR